MKTTDGTLSGFAFNDKLGRAQIVFISSQENSVDSNGVGIYCYDSSGDIHEVINAGTLNGGVSLRSMNGQNLMQATDNKVRTQIGSRNVFEAGTNYTYIRNPGSSKDYWIALDDNGVAICKGGAVLQRWS